MEPGQGKPAPGGSVTARRGCLSPREGNVTERGACCIARGGSATAGGRKIPRQPQLEGDTARMFLQEWEELKFNEAFDETIIQVRRLREHDPEFDIAQLKHMLHTACMRLENNMAGRSAVAEIAGEGAIAAYQQALAEWERELAGGEQEESD
jgi:hypothetical protein